MHNDGNWMNEDQRGWAREEARRREAYEALDLLLGRLAYLPGASLEILQEPGGWTAALGDRYGPSQPCPWRALIELRRTLEERS